MKCLSRTVTCTLLAGILLVGLVCLAACGSSAVVNPTTSASAAVSQTTASSAAVNPTTASSAPSPTVAASTQASGTQNPGSAGSGRPTYSDIAYASQSSSQKLDIYLPASGSGPFPVIVTIHGGAFFMGDKADGQQTPMLAALDRGYAVVPINYRLSKEATFPAAVNDVKAAIRWIRANAAKYNFDADKIVAWGDSAGAYLAAVLGTSGGVTDLEDMSQGNADKSSKVQAVVDWFGPIDFGAMDAEATASGIGPANHNDASSPESQFLGKALSSVPDLVKKADPTTYITSDDPPFLIEHGTKDTKVPTEQSVSFAAALTKVLGEGNVTLKLIEGADHMDPAFNTADNVKLVLDWIDRQLK